MTRGVRIRLMAFVVLSAVGITYITASYLGLVDRVTGRGIDVTAQLPRSGGLFVGSEVTYRGVKVGKVSAMNPTSEGVDVEIALEEETELPVDSALYVHNLSAVGEQYLDFQPADTEPPYAEDGTVFVAGDEALPTDEGDLLVDIDAFVGSVEGDDLEVAIGELGDLFEDTGADLQKLLDNGSVFIEEASEHTEETIRLLDSGLTVLRTQRDNKENIRSFAGDLATLTRALRRGDGDLRTVISEAPAAARELRVLLEDLEPTLPVFLSDLTTVGQVILSHIAGVEQLLVTYPPLIAAGPTGSTEDGYGHVNLQLDYSVPPCTQGYLPPEDWRSTQDLTDGGEIFPAKCTAGPPYVMRGSESAPAGTGGNASTPRYYSDSYDPVTREVDGVVDGRGNPVRFNDPANLSVLGGDAWKWMLVGPVKAP